MKKILLALMLSLFSIIGRAQIKLDQKDLNNLISISRIYSNNTNANGKDFIKAIDSFRTPLLNHIADALIETGKGEKTILESRFLSRPGNDELILWYIIREIHYNHVNKDKIPKPDSIVAREVLSQKIDERWLLDNYYYRIHGGIGTLFNDADLSRYNFNLDSLGLKNETEKAIFFLNMTDALIGGRINILQMMKNYNAILKYCDKLPQFNGKKYYYYKNLDYPDFDWIGYDKIESYNEQHLGTLYAILLAQMLATNEIRDKKEVQNIYFNSIMYEPKYFKFSKSENDLKALYNKSK